MGPHDIGWAVVQLKNGSRVRRPHWGAGVYVFSAETKVITFDRENNPASVETLYIRMPSLDRLRPFVAYHEDLLATDWEDAK
jgi:hypothetical protein